MQDYVREFYGIIQLIPKGRVATYGQIAKLAGLPKHARYVGFALKNMDDNVLYLGIGLLILKAKLA